MTVPVAGTDPRQRLGAAAGLVHSSTGIAVDQVLSSEECLNFRIARDPLGIWLHTLRVFRTFAAEDNITIERLMPKTHQSAAWAE